MIELLVSMVVASLIITPLLFFVVDVLNTDVREQAKTNSEQELQTALTFIANDLQKSVYMYDQTGIDAIRDQLPHNGDAEKVPVLVFWKQDIVERVLPINTKNADLENEHCENNRCDNAAVYSLVAYYLMTDDSDVWQGNARIGRFEIRDGVLNPAEYYQEYVSSDKVSKAKKDKGFKLFDISSNVQGTFEQKMEAWTKDAEPYEEDVNVLLDYISEQGREESDGALDCNQQLGQDSGGSAELVGGEVTITKSDDTTVTLSPDKTGFYACVDSTKNVAKVFITGDTYSRMDKDEDYQAKSAFFPQISVTIQGRGSLGQ